MKKLIISPHIDDEVLGCGGIIDNDTFVLYCGLDEAHITDAWVRNRPKIDERMKELKDVNEYLGYKYDILYNKVNHYVIQDLISSFEKYINEYKPEEVYIPYPSYNQDHKTVYNAALIALRPHDLNHFVKKILIYEQPHVFLWSEIDFKPNYFISIDIEKKIKAYEMMVSQVRNFRSPKILKSMATLRGAQSNYEFAEGYKIIRWVQ
jgi:LmbE family N-acetylglucosaminyl deacetylase